VTMLAVGVLDEYSSAGAFSRRAAFLLVQDPRGSSGARPSSAGMGSIEMPATALIHSL